METEINNIDNNDHKNNFDTNRAKKNVFFSVIFKAILFVLAFLTKRFLIQYIGNDANGLNTLYTSIIGFLSVADMGIGTAIIFCMYKPIANNDNNTVSMLYNLFKKVYYIIGIIVLVFGLIVLFFLPVLANGYDNNNELYIGYVLTLFSIVITYFYSAKLSLINAYKNNYITTTITSLSLIITNIVQIIFLIITRSFIAFNLCKIISSTIQFIVFSAYHKYDNITKNKIKANKEVSGEVLKNVKAMFLHKIGDVIFGTVDSLVISAVIGVITLGYYSNYLTILTAMNEMIKLFIVSLTSVIGHMGVHSNENEKKSHFWFFYRMNFMLGIIFYLGFYATSDYLVELCFGPDLSLDKTLVLVLTITYFIQFMRQTTSVFKDSFGLFYKDRWVAIIASVINVSLSVTFAYLFGIYGVLIATIIIDVIIYHVIEPFILFRYSFSTKPFKYYLINYGLMLFFVGELLLFSLIRLDFTNLWFNLLSYGSLSLAFNILPVLLMFIDKNFRKKVLKIIKK